MKKIRKCPFCKSKTGFEIRYILGGYHDFKISFSGKIIASVREGSDTIERFASCLNCNKSIDVDRLDVTV